tara:strand:- start:563 stop:805 length:243 start_codon:yes stop_codon:yes gene_type:complete
MGKIDKDLDRTEKINKLILRIALIVTAIVIAFVFALNKRDGSIGYVEHTEYLDTIPSVVVDTVGFDNMDTLDVVILDTVN